MSCSVSLARWGGGGGGGGGGVGEMYPEVENAKCQNVIVIVISVL